MRRFRSLLIERVNIRMPGLCIHTFALHRHLREHAAVEPHHHLWSQAILYIEGRGTQVFRSDSAPVSPGTLVIIPAGLEHSFERSSERTPQCLMINFRLRGERSQPRAVCSVNRSELAQVRQRLADLLRLQSGARGVLRWESSITILQLLMSLLRLAGWLERVDLPSGNAGGSAIRRLLGDMDPANPLSQLVLRSGYNRDHLNRLVRKETGLTLGQLRNQRRLAKAKKLLSAGVQVGNVAAAVGLLDQSYFARWFRRQTGEAPSRWTPRRSV
jgi:AraC family L-rhamnose operon transcriptional activator RhaR